MLQNVVQACRTEQQIARGAINLHKSKLLGFFNEFIIFFDGNYRITDIYEARPYAPGINDGQEAGLQARRPRGLTRRSPGPV